eukprot:390841_1
MSIHIAYPEYNTLVVYNINCIITAFYSFLLLQKLSKLPNIRLIDDLKSDNITTKAGRLRRLSTSICHFFFCFYEFQASGMNFKSQNIPKRVTRLRRLSIEEEPPLEQSITVPSLTMQTNSTIHSLSPLEMSQVSSISIPQRSPMPSLTKDSYSRPYSSRMNEIIQSPISSINATSCVAAFEICDLCNRKIMISESDSTSKRMKLVKLHNKIFHTDYFE